jgi:O-antigen/teichoic acid export membrane protein
MVVQDRVGHADWGLYAALLSLGFLLVALADLGMSPYLTRTLAAHPEAYGRIVPQLLTLKLFLLVLYPCVGILAGVVTGYRGEALGLLAMLCLVHAGGQMLQFFRAGLQARQAFKADSLLSVSDRIVLMGIVGVLLMGGIDIMAFGYARLAAAVLTALIAYRMLTRTWGALPVRWPTEGRDLLRQGLPFAWMTVLYSLHDKVDQVMLERIAGEVENGLYAAAYRWLDALSMYLWTVLPLFFARFARIPDQIDEQARLLRFGQVITALPILILCAWGWFYGDTLLLIFGHSTPEEKVVMLACLQALLAALALNGVFAIFSTLLTSTGHERYVSRLIVGSILLNTGLNLWLIPRWGAVGSAWATVASYAAMDIAYVIYIRYALSLKLPWGQMIRLGLIGVWVWLIAWGCHALNWPWWAAGGLIAAGGGAAAWSLGLLSSAYLRFFRHEG